MCCTTSGQWPSRSGSTSTNSPPTTTSQWLWNCTRRTWCSTPPTSSNIDRADRRHPYRGGTGCLAPVLAANGPGRVIRALGTLVFQAAAKDVRVNPEWAKLYGVLDNRFRRPCAGCHCPRRVAFHTDHHTACAAGGVVAEEPAHRQPHHHRRAHPHRVVPLN